MKNSESSNHESQGKHGYFNSSSNPSQSSDSNKSNQGNQDNKNLQANQNGQEKQNGQENKNQAQDMKNQAAEKLSEKAQDVKQDVAQGINKVTEQVNEWYHQSEESLKVAKECAEKKGEELRNYIQKAPVQSVLMGIGAGLLVGYLMSGRSDRRYC